MSIAAGLWSMPLAPAPLAAYDCRSCFPLPTFGSKTNPCRLKFDLPCLNLVHFGERRLSSYQSQ